MLAAIKGKTMTYSTVMIGGAAAFILASSACAADDLSGALKGGKLSGTFKGAYLETVLDNGAGAADAATMAVGGKLKYETAAVSGWSAAAAFMTTDAINGSSTGVAKYLGGSSLGGKTDPTLLINGKGGAVLGEAYVKYVGGPATVKFGRQEIDLPLVGTKETRILPTTFHALLASTKSLDGLTLYAGGIIEQKERNSDRLVTMGRAAIVNSTANGTGTLGGFGAPGGFGASVSTASLSPVWSNTLDSRLYAAGAVYEGITGAKLQLWDFYATDFINAVYVQGDYKTSLAGAGIVGAVQYLRESDTGNFRDALATVSAAATGLDASLYGAKIAASAQGGSLMLAYTQVSDSTASKLGGIIAPWDGTPAFTDTANNNNLPGFVVVDGLGTIYGGSYAAGSHNTKIQIDYDFAALGLKGLTGLVSRATYDRKYDPSRLAMCGYDVTEWDIVGKYAFGGSLKGLSVMGMVIPMDVKANAAAQEPLTGTKSDRIQYRTFVTYQF